MLIRHKVEDHWIKFKNLQAVEEYATGNGYHYIRILYKGGEKDWQYYDVGSEINKKRQIEVIRFKWKMYKKLMFSVTKVLPIVVGVVVLVVAVDHLVFKGKGLQKVRSFFKKGK